jgi:Protein of unknown function (DUF3738)
MRTRFNHDRFEQRVDGFRIFPAIREQLGLLLKSARGPVEVVAIDGVQTPTGNLGRAPSILLPVRDEGGFLPIG